MFWKIILFAWLFLLASGLKAQRFEGGALLGFNGSQVENSKYNGYNKPGLLGGFYVQTELSPTITAGMEIKYSQKGARNRIKPNEPVTEKYIMRLGYIDVPVYLGFRTSDKATILAGVSAGYLMHYNELDENGPFPPEMIRPFRTLDVQPFFGFRFDFLDRVTADLRFALSVLPIREVQSTDGTTSYWLNNQFNNVISLALYYRIDR
jgi:hypothetical protein